MFEGAGERGGETVNELVVSVVSFFLCGTFCPVVEKYSCLLFK